ncbi:MAG: hypothetical protein ACP5GC_07145 [Thiomonas sp.]
MINQTAVNESPINGDAAASDQPVGITGAQLRLRAYAKGQAACLLHLVQSETGTASVALRTTVSAPTGLARAPVLCSVYATGQARAALSTSVGLLLGADRCAAPLRTRLYATGTATTQGIGGLRFAVRAPISLDPSVPGSIGSASHQWRVSCQGLQLTGQVRIDAEENGARTASFVAVGQSVVEVGQSIAIDIEVGGGMTRLYSGFVEQFEDDPDANTCTVRCTDNLQRYVDALTQEQIDAITPGAITPPGSKETGYAYLNTRLQTLAASAYIRRDGGFVVVPWDAAASGGGVVIDRPIYGSVPSASTQQTGGDAQSGAPGSQTTTPNPVRRKEWRITLDLSWVRIAKTKISAGWQAGISLCEWLNKNRPLPSPGTIEQAVRSTGWDVEALGFERMQLRSGWVGCGSGAVAILVRPGTQFPARSASWTLSKRYTRTMRATMTWRIVDRRTKPGDIIDVQEKRITLRDPRDGRDWLDYGAGTLTAIDENGDAYADLIDIRDDQGAFGTAIMDAQRAVVDVGRTVAYAAAQAMARTMRNRRTLRTRCSTPLLPDIDLGQSATIQHPKLQRSGIITRLSHTLNITSGSATTDVEITSMTPAGGAAPEYVQAEPNLVTLQQVDASSVLASLRAALQGMRLPTRLPTKPEDDVTRGDNAPMTRYGGVLLDANAQTTSHLSEIDTPEHWQGWIANVEDSAMFIDTAPRFAPLYKSTGFFVRVPPINLPPQTDAIALGTQTIII